MSEVSYALQRIARGTGIIFVGTVISMLFGFFNRAIIARYFTTSEYGVFNLALTVLSIALVIATLGFRNSLPREVAFYKEKKPSKLDALISTALMIVLVNSVIWTVILILGAGDIAQVFDEERLTYSLKIIALALPLSSLIAIVVSISRGFGRVREKVYFQSIAYPTAFLIFIVLGILLDYSFTYVFFAYVLAQALTFLVLVFDVWKVRLFGFRMSLDLRIGKELIRFSLPLLFSGIMVFVMNWADTLMLGYYKSSEVVGLYNAASPLTKLIRIFLTSAAFLYPPIASQLYARGRINEMKRIYQILTKWIFILTLPVFSIMFLFPEATINFFFGTKYLSAAVALRILALGFMFHTFLGLNGQTLLVMGESMFIMASNLVSTIFNVILNALLIPIYGIEGAAIATATSYFVGNLLGSLRLYQKTKIHPFSRNYLKSLVISFVFLGLMGSVNLRVLNIWYVVLILVIFLGAYFFLVLLSRSVDKEDIELLLAIEKRLGINLRTIKKILKKFV
ncbi:flippase [Thermococci archaeon]|nr:MAG: flippase [Thermococci archaeon]